MVDYGLLGFGCGSYDDGLWVAGFWLQQLGWLVVAIYIGFLGFMKACNDDGGGWLWVCGDGEQRVVRVIASNEERERERERERARERERNIFYL